MKNIPSVPADLVGINNYLGVKYGISILSLAITKQPQNVSVEAGKKATFWVNAAGMPPLSCQWKPNSVTISGATSAVHTTPALTIGANGAVSTVIPTTPVRSTISDPALRQDLHHYLGGILRNLD